MKYGIVCRATGNIVRVPIEDRSFSWYGAQIGTDILEIVHPIKLKQPYMFFCDEEGKLRREIYLNVLGSWLYGFHDHGEPIVGDIMIMKEVMIDDDCDIDGMEESEADVLMEWLKYNFPQALAEMREALASMG